MLATKLSFEARSHPCPSMDYSAQSILATRGSILYDCKNYGFSSEDSCRKCFNTAFEDFKDDMNFLQANSIESIFVAPFSSF